MPKSFRSILLVLLALSLPVVARAQGLGPATRPDETEPVPGGGPSAEQMLSRMLKPQGEGAAPLQPLSEAPVTEYSDPRHPGAGRPGVVTAKAAAATRPTLKPGVLPEGTFLVDRAAHLIHDKSGRATLVFDEDGKTPKLAPMQVLPNLKLMAMEHAVASTDRQLTFEVTGMVTEYRGKNYFLMTVQPDMDSGPASRPPPGAIPAAPALGKDGRSLSAEEMLSRMLRPAAGGPKPLPAASEAPAADKASGNGAVAPGAPPLTVLREGNFLVERVGRLTRSPDGLQAEFTFESDGRAMRDPPVIVLPSQKLAALEDNVTAANRDIRFRLTGMLTEYRGRNYVLPEKIVVVLDTEAPL